MHVQFHHGQFFMLLKDRDYLGNDFQILSIKMTTGDFVAYTVKNIIPFYPTEFVISSKAALIGGYFNNRPLVLYYSLSQPQSRILPGFFNSPGELNQIKVYEDGSLDIIVSARNFEKRRALWIRKNARLLQDQTVIQNQRTIIEIATNQGSLAADHEFSGEERNNILYGVGNKFPCSHFD